VAEVQKQPVEKSHELLARSEFLGSRDRVPVISIERKRHSRRKEAEGRRAKGTETSRGAAGGSGEAKGVKEWALDRVRKITDNRAGRTSRGTAERM